ncbi:zinc finger C2HC domain-containing protein 1B [Ara ararauna]
MSQIPVARSQDLAPCRTCGRRFAQDVLLRHDPICRKVFNKKRKPFSSMKQRLQGTEIVTIREQHPQKKQPEKKSNWRQHHEDFINAIRSARQVTKALKEGRPLPPPPPPSINPDYIQCPHCSRRFNEAAAERHMKFCEEQAIRRAFAAKTARPVVSKHSHTCLVLEADLPNRSLRWSVAVGRTAMGMGAFSPRSTIDIIDLPDFASYSKNY